MPGPKWKQDHSEEALAGLVAALAMYVLPAPTLVLLVIGLWRHSAGCLTVAAALSVVGIVLLLSAIKVQRWTRSSQPPPPSSQRSTTPEQRRGSWPWA